MFSTIFWAVIVGLLTFFGLAAYIGAPVAVASITAAIAAIITAVLVSVAGRL